MKPEIKAEHERLHDILFEGAPDTYRGEIMFAAMDKTGWWYWYFEKPVGHCLGAWGRLGCKDDVPYSECKNQPETTLDWTQTLIRRKQ